MEFKRTEAEIKANEEAFATFMAQMILKYGHEILSNIEKSSEENNIKMHTHQKDKIL